MEEEISQPEAQEPAPDTHAATFLNWDDAAHEIEWFCHLAMADGVMQHDACFTVWRALLKTGTDVSLTAFVEHAVTEGYLSSQEWADDLQQRAREAIETGELPPTAGMMGGRTTVAAPEPSAPPSRAVIEIPPPEDPESDGSADGYAPDTAVAPQTTTVTPQPQPDEPAVLSCPHCHKFLETDEATFGSTLLCTHCGREIKAWHRWRDRVISSIPTTARGRKKLLQAAIALAGVFCILIIASALFLQWQRIRRDKQLFDTVAATAALEETVNGPKEVVRIYRDFLATAPMPASRTRAEAAIAAAETQFAGWDWRQLPKTKAEKYDDAVAQHKAFQEFVATYPEFSQIPEARKRIRELQARIELEKTYMDGCAAQDAGQFDKAVPLLSKSAKAGQADAQLRLAYLCEKGLGVAASDASALLWYTEAAKQGIVDAQAKIALYHLLGGTFEEPADLLREAGNWRWVVLRRSNVDLPKAVEQLNDAVRNQSATACYVLGVLHYWGIGVDRSRVEARRLCRQALHLGEQRAASVCDLLGDDAWPQEREMLRQIVTARQEVQINTRRIAVSSGLTWPITPPSLTKKACAERAARRAQQHVDKVLARKGGLPDDEKAEIRKRLEKEAETAFPLFKAGDVVKIEVTTAKRDRRAFIEGKFGGLNAKGHIVMGGGATELSLADLYNEKHMTRFSPELNREARAKWVESELLAEDARYKSKLAGKRADLLAEALVAETERALTDAGYVKKDLEWITPQQALDAAMTAAHHKVAAEVFEAHGFVHAERGDETDWVPASVVAASNGDVVAVPQGERAPVDQVMDPNEAKKMRLADMMSVAGFADEDDFHTWYDTAMRCYWDFIPFYRTIVKVSTAVETHRGTPRVEAKRQMTAKWSKRQPKLRQLWKTQRDVLVAEMLRCLLKIRKVTDDARIARFLELHRWVCESAPNVDADSIAAAPDPTPPWTRRPYEMQGFLDAVEAATNSHQAATPESK